MKIALLFLSHRPSGILAKFLDLIERQNQYVPFLHHDFSQSDLTAEILNHQSLSVLENYYITQWAHVSVVEATIALARHAFHNSSEFEWFILLSGSCYPIRPLHHLVKFLSSTNYDGFIEHTPLNQKTDWLHQAYQKHVFTYSLFHIPFISRKGKFYWRDVRKQRKNTPFSNDFRLYFGSQWWVLRRNVVNELISHNKLQELLEFARIHQIHASEEWLIQSIIGNLNEFNLKSENLHYINWDNSQNWHPNTLNTNYLASLISSGSFFARKFDDVESASLLKAIDLEIRSYHD